MFLSPAPSEPRCGPVVEEAAHRMELAIKPDAQPEQGHFYRSDHFSLAHAGVPAFSIDLGTEYYGKPAGYGDKIFEEYNDKHYHQPSDEYHDDWDFAGMEEAAQFGFLIGMTVANAAADANLARGRRVSPRALSGTEIARPVGQ